jgi:hypothetical protein
MIGPDMSAPRQLSAEWREGRFPILMLAGCEAETLLLEKPPDHRDSTLMTASQIKKNRRAITPWVVSTLPVFAPARTPSSPIASFSSFWQTAKQRFTSLAFW